MIAIAIIYNRLFFLNQTYQLYVRTLSVWFSVVYYYALRSLCFPFSFYFFPSDRSIVAFGVAIAAAMFVVSVVIYFLLPRHLPQQLQDVIEPVDLDIKQSIILINKHKQSDNIILC